MTFPYISGLRHSFPYIFCYQIIFPICRFQKAAALNVRSRLHYGSGWGGIMQWRAAAGQERPTVKRVSSRSTFDMRGGQGRQPLDVPLDGRVRHHCVFARMPGVFEPCTRLDHLGWLRYLASQTPLSRSIGSLASCSATGPFGSW